MAEVTGRSARRLLQENVGCRVIRDALRSLGQAVYSKRAWEMRHKLHTNARMLGSGWHRQDVRTERVTGGWHGGSTTEGLGRMGH